MQNHSLPCPSVAYECQPYHAAFIDLLDLVNLYIDHAKNAAHQNRLQAAHGLFQTALNFYDQSLRLATALTDPFSQGRLAEMRHHIDVCAGIIYEAERAPFMFSDELLKGK